MRALATAWVTLAASVAFAQTCPERSEWPTQEWPSRIDEVKATKADAIAALEAYGFTLVGADEDRMGIRTDGAVIIKNGAIIYENYGRGFDAQKRHLTWSVSKSFTSALVGLGVGKGLISTEDSICKHLVRLEGTDACRIKVQHLLEMASGLDWKEVYENESNQQSSVLAMLYGVGNTDAAAFVASHPFRDEPGTSWMYSSGDTTLLMGALQAALEPTEGRDFPWTLLFDRIGMRSATWEADQMGTLIGSSYLYATPRDMAKFGFLYLNDGCWENERVLPEDWVQWSVTVNEPIKQKAIFRDDDTYGRQWWLNAAVPEVGYEKPFPDLPEDTFMARGHWGQSIVVIPSEDLIVVRTADDREKAFDLQTWVKLAREVAAP